jgi:hypothetical protein
LRASATSSCTVLAGSVGRTTSAWPKFRASSVIGEKSFTAS